MKRKILSLCMAVVLVMLTFGAVPVSAQTDGNYKYTVTDEATTVTGYNTSLSGDFVIPDTLGGYPVTSIGERAFLSCSKATSVTIPDSVTSI